MQQNLGKYVDEKREFANSVLDPLYQTLATSNKIIRLRGKLFSVLCCLVDNQNKLVTREQLIEQCWYGNRFTGQKAVTHTICHLRKMLKQQEIQASIMTLSKQGYIFTTEDTQIVTDHDVYYAKTLYSTAQS